MYEMLVANWIYILVGIVVVGVAFFLLTNEPKQHIDISGDAPKTPSATLDRLPTRPLRPASDNFPFPINYRPPPRSPLPRDNLLILKGVGPNIAARLDHFNFTRYEHIAAWRREDYEEIGIMIGQPVERIVEDRWVEQAKLLAEHRYEEYEAEYGKINQEDFNRFKEDTAEP